MAQEGNKVFVVLDEEQQMLLERINVDRDPEEALEFIEEVILPQVKDKGQPCFEGYEKFLKKK
ncbi:hypothetical protein [Halarsenatibacter silvermanii]|nr:hypothetical protein [Halarsenatibacter silvermanii]